MHRIVIGKPGGYERLRLETQADPNPAPGEVLIAVEAVGVNYADCMIRMGLYESAKKQAGYPITPGFEAAGTVAAVGDGVSDLQPGERVVAVSLFNGYSTMLAVSREQVFRLPENLSFEQAAAIPTAFLTAWFALAELAHPHKDDAILVHSAAGGVGSALVQLGKLMSCRVIGVVGAGHKIAYARACGADAVIDKSEQDLWVEAERLSPEGYAVILDANGAATLKHSYAHLAAPGKLVVYGFHSMLPKGRSAPNWFKLAWDWLRTPRFNPLEMTGANRSVLAFNLSYLTRDYRLLVPAMNELLDRLADGDLQPPRVQTYPFGQVGRAHRDLESGQTVGKLVLVV